MQGKRIIFLPKSSTSFCSTTSFVRSSSVSVLIWRLEEEVEEEEKERGELEEEGMEEEAVGNTEDILEDFGVIDEATIKEEDDDWIEANGVGRKEESATDAAANDDSTVEIVQLSRLFRSREFDSDNESVVLVAVKEATKESSDDEDVEEEMEDGDEEEGALYTGDAAVLGT